MLAAIQVTSYVGFVLPAACFLKLNHDRPDDEMSFRDRVLWPAFLLVLGEPCDLDLDVVIDLDLPAPSGANKKSFLRGAPIQHLAPRLNPECSNAIRALWIRILISLFPRIRRGLIFFFRVRFLSICGRRSVSPARRSVRDLAFGPPSNKEHAVVACGD